MPAVHGAGEDSGGAQRAQAVLVVGDPVVAIVPVDGVEYEAVEPALVVRSEPVGLGWGEGLAPIARCRCACRGGAAGQAFGGGCVRACEQAVGPGQARQRHQPYPVDAVQQTAAFGWVGAALGVEGRFVGGQARAVESESSPAVRWEVAALLAEADGLAGSECRMGHRVQSERYPPEAVLLG